MKGNRQDEETMFDSLAPVGDAGREETVGKAGCMQ